MSTLKKFFIYFLMLAAFFIISNILENGLILNMYGDISGNVEQRDDLELNVLDAKATKVNGYMNFKITNYYMPDVSTTTKSFEDVIDALDKNNIKYKTPTTRSTYKLGNASIKVQLTNLSKNLVILINIANIINKPIMATIYANT